MKAEETVKKTIEANGLIPAGSTVILALSGGPDSLCLLHMLLGLRERSGFDLHALHVNHMIRGREADEDEAFVAETCKELGVPVRIIKKDVPAMAKEQGLSEEDAGRRVRYRALFEYKRELEEGGRTVLIALAHNRDDQAETVLMRIIRGTGVHGLGAMEYKRKDGVIRPLLDTSREAVEEYCQRKGLSPRIDRTNGTGEYTRNDIRLRVLPALEECSPRVKDSLVRLAAFAREDDARLRKEAEEILERECVFASGSAVLRTSLINDLSPAVSKRIIALALAELGLSEDLSAERIAAVLSASRSGRGGLTIELPRGFRALISKGKLTLASPGEK
ncbi:MAG: tRNA lysidine(34) synthetase TilS [Firmicutes bacterium]|nr:tRNA lysidine(34) synthetase TilS [Bacillota bacterium]